MNLRLLWKKRNILNRGFKRTSTFSTFFTKLLLKKKKYLHLKNSKFFRILEGNFYFYFRRNLKINTYYDLFFWSRFLKTVRKSALSYLVKKKSQQCSFFSLKYNNPLPLFFSLSRTFTKIRRALYRSKRQFLILSKFKKVKFHFAAVEFAVFFYSNYNSFVDSNEVLEANHYQSLYLFFFSRFVLNGS